MEIEKCNRRQASARLKPLVAAKAKAQQIRKPESVLPNWAKQKPIDTE